MHSTTYIESLLRAAIPTHVDADASECLFVRARTRARIGGAAAHNGRAASKTGRVRPGRPSVARRRAESGAYPFQGHGARSVPRADVRVERRRPVERLQAGPGPRRRKRLA
jgi:hypothetical protein